MISPSDSSAVEALPLELFSLGRRIRQGLARCSREAACREKDDVFYLWLQTEPVEGAPSLTSDQWMNIIDEAAALGVNWLVLTVGTCGESRRGLAGLGRWAHEAHGMVVCLHARCGEISAEEREMLLELPRESTFLLVDPEYRASFSELAQSGVCVDSANPASHEDSGRTACEYPHKMIFVDARGRLYTCGMVAGNQAFYLGTVLDGSLDAIIHNPQLPHSVSAAAPEDHARCSGCPPLVAQHLCNR